VVTTPTSRVLVLGATGRTGQQVVAQALEQGHAVTVFVRDPARLNAASERLAVVIGDVTRDSAALVEAVRDNDAVISALGVGDALKANGLIAGAVPTIVAAMQAAGVRRLIFTSAYGVAETIRDTPLIPRLLIRSLLKDLYADKNAGERELRRIGGDIDWTLVYPTTLTNGPRTGRYRFGERLSLRGVPRVSRADVADFLLTQLLDRTYVNKGVLVSS
jgi:putative NADH-flavin reductase